MAARVPSRDATDYSKRSVRESASCCLASAIAPPPLALPLGTDDPTFPSDEHGPDNNSVTEAAKGDCGDNIQSIIDDNGSFLSEIDT